MQELYCKLPKKSIPLIKKWINEVGTKVYLRKSRKSKLGDFRVYRDNNQITINNDLSPFLLLITLTHEIAHAFVWKEYKRSALPHGTEWKTMFQTLLTNLIDLEIFPEDITKALQNHLKRPFASLLSDINLSIILRQYNSNNNILISSLQEGELFKLINGKIFRKGKKLRKRFKCREIKTKQTYFFHPLAEITPL